jgi:hypothetical protein
MKLEFLLGGAATTSRTSNIVTFPASETSTLRRAGGIGPVSLQSRFPAARLLSYIMSKRSDIIWQGMQEHTRFPTIKSVVPGEGFSWFSLVQE